MNVLIVENDQNLGRVWQSHIERQGVTAVLQSSEDGAVAALQEGLFDVLIVNLNLREGSALAVAEYSSYRQPDAKVIFVTSSSFFSDGSIFNFISNACALVPHGTSPDDLAALVDYHGR